jgi:ABC-type uncharacterized transport system substrate-binding protein
MSAAFSSQTTDLAGKHLILIREIVPGLRRLAILANVGNAANVLDIREVQAAARGVGVNGTSFEIRRTQDIAAVFATFKVERLTLYTLCPMRSCTPTGFVWHMAAQLYCCSDRVGNLCSPWPV